MKKLSASKALICPQLKDVFKAFKLCPFHNLRTVVIGMDPYNNLRDDKPVATGIAFANSSDTPEESYSPSLAILKESVIDFTIPHGTVNFDPSLEKWEEQGVLLLNSALSCVIGRPGSHSLMWRPFMKSLLISLSRNASGIVYVLMGSDAQSFEPYISKVNNHIIKAKHPAWYARQKIRMPSDIWREINTILIGQNGYGIEWFKEYKLLNNREDEEVLHE
jgi:uracil-DNA glycosylase